MKVLDLRKVISLIDFYRLYEEYLKSQLEEQKVYSVIAKTKTSLIRFVLPEWGFPLKLDGNLSPAETLEGLKFMENIPIYQAVHALEVQERVFDKFGDRASPASRRVYRSALRKMMEWGRSQDWWKESSETSSNGRAPTMLVFKKRVEHWHKLKSKELPPRLSQQLDSFSVYLSTLRQPRLNENSCIRFRREILGIFGWLHRVKGIPLAELSLTELVPIASIYDADATERVVAQAEEYIEWMRSNLGGKETTLKLALRAFFLIADYITLSTENSETGTPTILVIEALKKLRNRLHLTQYPKTTNRIQQEAYALDTEDVSSDLRAELDSLLDALVNPHSDINCFKERISVNTAMSRMANIHRLLGWLYRVKKIPLEELRLTHLVSFVPMKMALRRAKTFDEVRQIEQATLEAADNTSETLTAALNWLRRERQIHPSTEKIVVEAFLTVAKFLYYKETDFLKADNYGDIPAILLLRRELKKAKERINNAPPASDESLKWLDWPEFLACVHHLEQECQPTYSYGLKRSPTAIARSVQRYLLFAFLAYIPPDRQRTLRELEVNKTLVKGLFNQDGVFETKGNGRWYIHLLKDDYKTGKTYGEQWLMVPDILNPYLEAWLNQWRAQFSPNHNFVFTTEKGKPFEKPSELSGIIRRATYRLTGKLTTSHLIRHMLITYMKRNGASDEMMRSLAEAMRHSTEIQSQIYDRRHRIEKVAPAQELVLRLAMGEPVAQLVAGQSSLTVEELVQQIRQLCAGDRQRLLVMLNNP